MKQLSEFSITELKAMSYDQLVAIERAQINLKTINEELSKRQQLPAQKEEKIEKHE